MLGERLEGGVVGEGGEEGWEEEWEEGGDRSTDSLRCQIPPEKESQWNVTLIRWWV